MKITMWFHWLAILFLVGTPLAGLVGAIPAAMIAGAIGLLVAEVHAGMWDEILDAFADRAYEKDRLEDLE